MKKLPKELTSELLGLVLGKEVSDIDTTSYKNEIEYMDWSNNGQNILLNLDTLSRLMIEKLRTTGYIKIIEYSDRYIIDLAVEMVDSGMTSDCLTLEHKLKVLSKALVIRLNL